MNILQSTLFLFISFVIPAYAQSQGVTEMSREECEAIFLKKNLQLIAEKLNISQAEAILTQAKLWPNPTLEIDEVNLWATKKQLAVFGDELQGFDGGDFGKNQQLSVSIEQLIITAGERKKLVALEEVSVEKSKEYFEDLLRNLKLEFRNQLTLLQYLQLSSVIYEKQIVAVKQLTESYQRQVEKDNIAKGEYIRLKALELEIAKDLNDLNKEIYSVQKELKLLMHLPASVQLKITTDDYTKKADALKNLNLDDLFNQAKESRPDYKIAVLEELYFNKLYTYEKASRVPNITLKGGYDRGGNFMYNFVGFGIGIDLPVFNRNQGNIHSAQIGMEHSKLLFDYKEIGLENEIVLAYQHLKNAIQFISQIDSDYEETLDGLLNSYNKNFTSRNISLLEYLDFWEAYLENKIIILQASREVNEKIEELNYSIGIDVIN